MTFLFIQFLPTDSREEPDIITIMRDVQIDSFQKFYKKEIQNYKNHTIEKPEFTENELNSYLSAARLYEENFNDSSLLDTKEV